MIENITKQINSFLSALKTTYSQQGKLGKILFPGLFFLLFCCLCSILISLFPRNSSNVVPSPNGFPTEGTQATPTPLFNFEFPTFTPFPTLPPSTALPSLTPLPTGTETPTQNVPTATGTSIPLATATAPPIRASATLTATSGGSIRIIAVDKPAEYVDIQNLSNAAVDLRGWRLVSETGDQSCALRGSLQPDEVLRIWARRGNPGFDCGFSFNIWNDNKADPAVLYDPQGEEVSRFP
jgi:hypothetical protein